MKTIITLGLFVADAIVIGGSAPAASAAETMQREHATRARHTAPARAAMCRCCGGALARLVEPRFKSAMSRL
jgi:hypothetical protein